VLFRRVGCTCCLGVMQLRLFIGAAFIVNTGTCVSNRQRHEMPSYAIMESTQHRQSHQRLRYLCHDEGRPSCKHYALLMFAMSRLYTARRSIYDTKALLIQCCKVLVIW
jgi:rRNA pseudouridine-1189 N-methylase Emg1 (Nep1/Mra1 family)